jgi:hypothetical protein
MMIRNVLVREWIYVSTVPTIQEMQQYLPNIILSTASHTRQEDPTFIVRYVVVLSS